MIVFIGSRLPNIFYSNFCFDAIDAISMQFILFANEGVTPGK